MNFNFGHNITSSITMSFIDLATLALHRRNEMEARITVLTTKCDQAIEDIMKLKFRAQSFVNQLNCEPSELKERFLNCMKTLDEYIYLMTDFNLSVGKLDEINGSIEYAPVHDTSSKTILTPRPMPLNIMDMLSEPAPSTSTACPNFCPLEHRPKKKVPKDEQTLIVFSSTSCSSESMPMKSEVDKKEKEVQCQLAENLEKVSLNDPRASDLGPLPAELVNLPAQLVLQTDHTYPATIMHVDGPSLWLITEDTEAACMLMMEMTSYYKENRVDLTREEVTSLTYCAFYDYESDCYYRAMFIQLLEEDQSTAEVFLMDTGEVRVGTLSALQPLAAPFAARPPFARCAHLAGVDLLSNSCHKDLTEKQEKFLRQYVGTRCSIEVDDNTSESLGVYVILSETETLNELLVKEGLAWSCDKPLESSTPAAPSTGPPELAALSDFDLADCLEYEDPVEAVTGYSGRDEIDICKHYKGGPEKSCFKGPRCKKRHVLLHPDGWTLDRIEVAGKCPSVPLPLPGTWHRALITYVAHFDRLYVQLQKDKGDMEEMDKLPDFGVILPPRSLEALIKDMNSPATRITYKPLKIMPAVGELVVALYPPDGQWYRARVLSVTRADQTVEVMYIDYGNVVWVKEDAIRELEPRFTMLPAQAVRCVLAGVKAKGHDPKRWADAKDRLAGLTLEQTLHLRIIARDYDEMTVEVFDENGYSVAEHLAAAGLVTLCDYSVIDDANVTQQIVVP